MMLKLGVESTPPHLQSSRAAPYCNMPLLRGTSNCKWWRTGNQQTWKKNALAPLHHLYESPDCSFLPDCFTGTATLVRQTQMLRHFTNRHFANPAYDSLRTCPAFGGWVLPPASTNANQPPRTSHASNHNQCVRVWWKTMENWALTQAKCAKCMANSYTKQICWLWGGLPILVLPQTTP